uniref:Uncharacterized protein n=1 Tax=Trichobilharzia regenti TaxID=157069 RepID=A0AA85IKQ4_TRIRE|nr:unnamed protein product [Trichobilharzia regenti]
MLSYIFLISILLVTGSMNMSISQYPEYLSRRVASACTTSCLEEQNTSPECVEDCTRRIKKRGKFFMLG